MKHYPNIESHRQRLQEICGTNAVGTGAGTPVFVCDPSILIDRYKQLTHSLTNHWGPHIIGYSFKTNYLVAESQILQHQGAWAEVVSRREYDLALRLGYRPDRIIYNGPYKDNHSLSIALAGGSRLNINDHDELSRLIELVGHMNGRYDIGIRVTSDLPRLGLSRFGFSLEDDDAIQAVRRIAACPALKLVGLHSHLYGDTDDPELYATATRRMSTFARQYLSADLQYLDMGGGYPAHSPCPKSRQVWQPRPIDVYVSHIGSALQHDFSGPDKPTLIVEPGRYLTCDAIVLITRIVHLRHRSEKQQIVCDGSLSMVPLTHYCPQIVRLYDHTFAPRNTPLVPTSIQGATCRENDSLFEGDFMQADVGDYLVHFAAGAYNSSLTPNFIFTAPAMAVL